MSVQILLGKPGKAICEAVDSQKPDLLVLGSAGKNNIKGTFILLILTRFRAPGGKCQLLLRGECKYRGTAVCTIVIPQVIVCRVPVKDDDGKVLAPQNLKKEWRGFVDHVGGETSEY